MSSEDYIPLPPQAVPGSELGESADQPKLDQLVGETICIKALEWIGQAEPYMGVRLFVHLVKGDKMTPRAEPYRAYTAAVLRVIHALPGANGGRQVKLEKWPIYRVVKSGTSYALSD